MNGGSDITIITGDVHEKNVQGEGRNAVGRGEEEGLSWYSDLG